MNVFICQKAKTEMPLKGLEKYGQGHYSKRNSIYKNN